MGAVNARSSRVVILGGGPGGYEAALVAAHVGAEVTVVERTGIGGAAVLTDCVPSKALISTADYMSDFETAADLGVHLEDQEGDEVSDAIADLPEVNRRVVRLARAQSDDIRARLLEVGVRVVEGTGSLVSPSTVRVDDEQIDADVVLVATGASPRVMDTAVPDGERILTWQQIYDLPELPQRLVVVGSGVTGAELAQAYLGSGPRSSSSPRATASCRARTPTPPRSSRRSSASAGWRCSGARGWRPSSAPPTACSCASRTAARSRLARAAGGRVGPRRRAASASRRSGSSSRPGARRRRPGLAHVRPRRLRGG